MKKILLVVFIILLVIFCVPYVIVSRFSTFYNQENFKKNEPYKTISVYVHKIDEVRDMDMSQYLKEVVSAEMPAEFEKEALKAQAIAARTYLVNRKMWNNEDAKKVHKGADICTDSTHCKAWISEADKKQMWAEDKREEYWDKISSAVDETSGIIITYDNKPISALFHSTSSGFTENAEDVWSSHVPYLVSVESKGEENSPRYQSQSILSEQEFKSVIEKNVKEVNWEKGLVGEIKRSDAGGIISIQLGGVVIRGLKFREMFNLRSTNVEIVNENGNIIMNVKGNGHGVGMSQYGANYMAGQGAGYEEILKAYYTGVEIG